jgi:ribosomal protein S18 acetylase RimI-like enzyme
MLELLQKNGFRITGIIHDYYLRSFRQKIIENGILCRDMIRLSLDLKS